MTILSLESIFFQEKWFPILGFYFIFSLIWFIFPKKFYFQLLRVNCTLLTNFYDDFQTKNIVII